LRLYQAVLEAPFRPSKTFLNESEFANAIVVPQTSGIINAGAWQMSSMSAAVIIRDTLKIGCASNMLLTCETIVDGKFVEEWVHWNTLGLLRQIGAVPPSPS